MKPIRWSIYEGSRHIDSGTIYADDERAVLAEVMMNRPAAVQDDKSYSIKAGGMSTSSYGDEFVRTGKVASRAKDAMDDAVPHGKYTFDVGSGEPTKLYEMDKDRRKQLEQAMRDALRDLDIGRVREAARRIAGQPVSDREILRRLAEDVDRACDHLGVPKGHFDQWLRKRRNVPTRLRRKYRGTYTADQAERAVREETGRDTHWPPQRDYTQAQVDKAIRQLRCPARPRGQTHTWALLPNTKGIPGCVGHGWEECIACRNRRPVRKQPGPDSVEHDYNRPQPITKSRQHVKHTAHDIVIPPAIDGAVMKALADANHEIVNIVHDEIQIDLSASADAANLGSKVFAHQIEMMQREIANSILRTPVDTGRLREQWRIK